MHQLRFFPDMHRQRQSGRPFPANHFAGMQPFPVKTPFGKMMKDDVKANTYLEIPSNLEREINIIPVKIRKHILVEPAGQQHISPGAQ
jgi:hypothetical protein